MWGKLRPGYLCMNCHATPGAGGGPTIRERIAAGGREEPLSSGHEAENERETKDNEQRLLHMALLSVLVVNRYDDGTALEGR